MGIGRELATKDCIPLSNHGTERLGANPPRYNISPSLISYPDRVYRIWARGRGLFSGERSYQHFLYITALYEERVVAFESHDEVAWLNFENGTASSWEPRFILSVLQCL